MSAEFRLSDEQREALTLALCAPDPERAPVTEIQLLYVAAAVERIVGEAVAEARADADRYKAAFLKANEAVTVREIALDRAEAAERALVARLTALADDWVRREDATEEWWAVDGYCAADDLRAALAGSKDDGQPCSPECGVHAPCETPGACLYRPLPAGSKDGERPGVEAADEWPCDNYTAPLTCLTAPSTETGRCDQCRPAEPATEGGRP